MDIWCEQRHAVGQRRPTCHLDDSGDVVLVVSALAITLTLTPDVVDGHILGVFPVCHYAKWWE